MHSSNLGSQLPPPYRAPPTPLVLLKAGNSAGNLNCSEPNIATRAEANVGRLGNNTGNISGNIVGNNTNYVGADALRDAAQKMFSRNRMERSSLTATPNVSVQGRRHSYAVNSRLPPSVPPKPRTSNAEDNELRNIVRNSNSNTLGRSGTPPLPAFLSLTPPPNAAKDLLAMEAMAQSLSGSRRSSTKAKENGTYPREEPNLTKDNNEMNNEEEEEEDLYDLQDAHAIRQQLDGLEAMYAEVLKMLGLRKFGRQPLGVRDQPGGGQLRRGNQLYGSMSSLPSVGNSSVGSRLVNRAGNSRGANKRFQRLEAHVVTLARSVAALSSQQAKLQQELTSLRLHLESSSGPRPLLSSSSSLMASATMGNLAEEHTRRVRKLSQFFGEEPPLLRLFLKRLGYEKFASLLEEAQIGLLELPYVTENRLERLGLPLGPRSRILQEARKMTQQGHHNNIGNNIGNNMGNNMGNNIGNTMGNNVGNNMGNKVGNNQGFGNSGSNYNVYIL